MERSLIDGNPAIPDTINLHEIGPQMVARFPALKTLYIFGSRRHQTMSTRSDIDVLAETEEPLLPYKVIEFIEERCPPLDVFLIEGEIARSCKNQSYIKGPRLIEKLDALKFWSREEGSLHISINPLLEINRKADFSGTIALGGFFDRSPSWYRMLEEAEKNHLPTAPFIGADIYAAVQFICKILDRISIEAEDLSGKGRGRNSWITSPRDEYEWQDLIYIALKPWLPGLQREGVTLIYDKQDKRADFHLFKNRLIVEVKYVKDANTKAAVLKTLTGLGDLYSQNANVQAVLFVIFANRNAKIDSSQWSSDFSKVATLPNVIVKVIQVH